MYEGCEKIARNLYQTKTPLLIQYVSSVQKVDDNFLLLDISQAALYSNNTFACNI